MVISDILVSNWSIVVITRTFSNHTVLFPSFKVANTELFRQGFDNVTQNNISGLMVNARVTFDENRIDRMNCLGKD